MPFVSMNSMMVVGMDADTDDDDDDDDAANMFMRPAPWGATIVLAFLKLRSCLFTDGRWLSSCMTMLLVVY